MTRFFLALLLTASSHAADFYASPLGSQACDGSPSCPWDLQTGLNKPLVGGDRLLLGGGIYTGNFTSALNGGGAWIAIQPSDPSFPPRINGSIRIDSGGWVIVQGLELFNSNTNRSASLPACGISLYAGPVQVIHNVIHDCSGDGLEMWSASPNSVAYGNLIYYVGWNGTDRGHGHGMYIQSNAPDWKMIQDNVVLNNFGWGLHSYTEGGHIDNITYRGNTVYMNGSLSTVGLNENILTGGLQVAVNPIWDSNIAYFPISSASTNGDAGYVAGWSGGSIVNNWFMGGYPLSLANANPAMSGNRLSKGVTTGSGKKAKTTCLNGATCGIPALTAIVRPDTYEPGRGIVTVVNLSSPTASSVSVPVASLGYANGESVMVASAEDYFGAHRSFVVTNGAITLSLTGWTVAQPIGWSKPASTLPQFGAFIFRRGF